MSCEHNGCNCTCGIGGGGGGSWTVLFWVCLIALVIGIFNEVLALLFVVFIGYPAIMFL